MLLRTKKYLFALRLSSRNSVTYLGELLYRSLLMLIILYIFIRLWSSVTPSSDLNYPQTIWYLLITEVIMFSRTGVGQVISQEVIDGSISYTMSRPYHYLLYQFSTSLGESIIRLAVNFAAGALLVTFLVGSIPLTWWVALPVIVSVLTAFLLDFCVVALIGLLAFFFEDTAGFFFIYQKILFILGGLLIPLDFFPNWLQVLAKALPFQLVLYAPAKLAIKFSWGTFLSTITHQAIWITALFALLSMVYRLGLRRLSVNGG